MLPAIAIQGLGKSYVIQHGARMPYQTLRESLASGWGAFSRRKTEKETFWALKDVSLQIMPGEAMGIIGRNGAGKSTLLKILSRITKPTEGRIAIRGRISSLLEVGTGFHPELSGTENIYLSGAIMGMKRTEIRRKFDEIVAFAEVEKFLDTPVKRYSSGMYVRLAFAVAAHLEPDILIVDEVLAVGDANFQKKCLGKMQEVSTREGSTVLFVSHNMGTISSLCSKVALLGDGQLVYIGEPAEIIRRYHSSDLVAPTKVDFIKIGQKIGDDYAQLLGCCITQADKSPGTPFAQEKPIRIEVTFRILQKRKFTRYYPFVSLHVLDPEGRCVFHAMPQKSRWDMDPGDYGATCDIPARTLNNSSFTVGVGFSDCDIGIHTHFFEPNALSFEVAEDVFKNIEIRNGYMGELPGPVKIPTSWKLESLS